MGEANSDDFNSKCQQLGITHTMTCPYSSNQNAVIERQWRTMTSAAISLLLTSGLSEYYWEEARRCACYVYNRIPSTRTDLQPLTPYRYFYGRDAPISHFQIFGSKCFVYIPNKDKGDHLPRATEGIFVGY